MFLRLLPFELNLQMRQIGFYITCAILFLLGFGVATLLAFNGGDRIKLNGALVIAGQASLLGIASIFFGAIYVVSGVMRDTTHKSLEMIHATPVLTPAMIFSRFTGVVLATFLSIMAGMLGMLMAQFAPWVDQQTLGPFNLIYYLHPIVFLIGINSLIVSAIFTLVATTTRNRTLVYVSAIALFIFYIIASSIPTDLAPKLIIALLGPFGDAAMTLDTETWVADEQNTRLLPLDAYFGLNRVVWSLLAFSMFAISFFTSTRGIKKSRKKATILDVADTDGEFALHALDHPTSQKGLPTIWSRFKLEYLTSVKSVSFIVLSALFVPFFAFFIFVQFFLLPETPIPTSRVFANIIFASAATPMVLMTIFFGGEILWRDKTVKINELVDASPARNWPLLAGKWLSLYAMILTLVALGILVGIICQLLSGNYDINLTTYLSAGFVRFAPRILFFATLVMFIQNFMPNRIAGMIVGGIVVTFFFVIFGFIPYTHPLMDFGVTPGGGYSEMGGFGNLTNYVPFLIYWTALCALFVVVSVWLWRRGLQTSLPQRFKTIGSNINLPNGLVAGAAVLIFLGTGLRIYDGYNNDNDFRTTKDTERFTAQYEKDLGDRMDDALPKVRDAKLDVQFYPSAKAAHITGTYRIENVTDAPLSDLYLTVPMRLDEGVNTLDLQGAQQSLKGEDKTYFEKYFIRRFVFDTPLAPGDFTTLTFDLMRDTPSLGGGVAVRSNGTFRNNQQIMPNIGLPRLRLQNPSVRRRYELPELPELPDRDDQEAAYTNMFSPSGDYINFEATICTDPGQLPFAPGNIIREYEKDGRPCRDFKPNEPITYFTAYVSADFETREDEWRRPDGRPVKLGIYYDHQHAYNVDIMMQAMKDSLKVMTEEFGPYQFDTLRIMEFPFGFFAQSFPNTIAFSENMGFIIDPGDADDNQSLDLATYVTMHEIGHQWFGHQIIPANTKGFNVLSEGLTENAAMTAYEATYGWQKARRVLQRRSIDGIQGYILGQAGEARNEEPLATARGDQQYIYYAKANWVFWGMKQNIGEDKIQGAIRKFVTDFGRKGPPYPTTVQLIDYLRDAAGTDYDQLITDYWERITFWELALSKDNAKLTATPGGKYKVDLTVELDKTVSSKETGRAISVLEAEYADAEDDADEGSKGELLREAEELNEWIEIGFYENDPGESFGEDWISLERVRLTSTESELSFTLDKKPGYVLLDPRRLLIEVNVTDNEVELDLADDS